MRIHKLALFAIWKVSSAILSPIGTKTPAWLRQSIAGAQPWLLTGCYVPSQTFSKFLGCGIGIEFARSKRFSMPWAFPSPWHTPTHVPTTIRIWKVPGHDGQRDRGRGGCSSSTRWEHPGLLGTVNACDGATAPFCFLPFHLIIFFH